MLREVTVKIGLKQYVRRSDSGGITRQWGYGACDEFRVRKKAEV